MLLKITVENYLCFPGKQLLTLGQDGFNNRINHFILPTKQWLHKIQKINSPNCDRCGTEIETLNHLFIECGRILDCFGMLFFQI